MSQYDKPRARSSQVAFFPHMAGSLVNESHDIGEIIEVIRKYGCIHIRNVFYQKEIINSRGVIADVRAEIESRIRNSTLAEEIQDGYLKRGSVCLKYLPSIVELLEAMITRSLLPRLAGELFQSRVGLALGISHLRCVEPNNVTKYSPMHQDGFFLSGRSINICIPFTAYGGAYSGLSLMPGIRENKSVEDVNLLLADDTKTWLPEVLAGDVLIFDPYVPHHRHYGDHVTADRINIEARLRPQHEVTNSCLPLVALPN